VPDNLVSNDVDQAIRFVETRCADSHQQGMFLELLREVKASNLPVQNISVMDLNGWRLRVTVPREEQCAYAVIDSVDSEDRVAVAWWNGLYDDHEEVCWTDLPLNTPAEELVSLVRAELGLW